ncbi:hypothetical protein BS47DRAFT_1370073 [Hydnum rufescens UP504]|uniref:Uncharacterized protein n=1 Tax=Hydnum rufescens UP504 TaxID=1448309 RepID=A0A9P6AAZ3_9AGAM|nr:hypothetical protein BS47DRAFT_1370073 [Hydnum rufescens UP504]
MCEANFAEWVSPGSVELRPENNRLKGGCAGTVPGFSNSPNSSSDILLPKGIGVFEHPALDTDKTVVRDRPFTDGIFEDQTSLYDLRIEMTTGFMGVRGLPNHHCSGLELSKVSMGKDFLGSTVELVVEAGVEVLTFFWNLGNTFCELPDDDTAGVGDTSIEEHSVV